MKKSSIFLYSLFLMVFIGGCSSTAKREHWYQDTRACALVGTVLGGGIGAANDSHEVAEGALIGAVVGASICAILPDGTDPDSDGDGIPDSRDQCPNTPRGVKVDGTGCALDSDGDGVPDYKDKCPNTPAGAEVNADGCELDSDGDGVVDSIDRCPETPAGTSVNQWGCEPDSDGDGVVDSVDQCPDTPQGAQVDGRGCLHIVLRGVLFANNSSVLSASAQTTLDEVAVPLQSRPDIDVMISGHTDSVGSDASNLTLSRNRAQSVKQYLVSRGISSAQLSTEGLGESQPVEDNDSASGRAQNRRVELNRR